MPQISSKLLRRSGISQEIIDLFNILNIPNNLYLGDDKVVDIENNL
jgi:hypothetical protein